MILSARQKSWKAYYAANRDKIRKRLRRYDEDNREMRIAYHKEYRARPLVRAQTKERNRAYYQTHREEKAASNSRRIRIQGIYMGMGGMTEKQRRKFIDEVNNGKAKRS